MGGAHILAAHPSAHERCRGQIGDRDVVDMGSSPNNYNLADNWWGTTNQTAIANAIYDSKNDFNLGTVNFLPIFFSTANS